MSVPGHDERDYIFARKYDLPVRGVVRPENADVETTIVLPFMGEGVSVESGRFTGLSTPACKEAVIQELEKTGAGRGMVTYKLRDWLFSRQRYWGEPFPLITLEDGTVKPLPLEDLPVELPVLDDFKPTADGQPPLARAREWVNATDPATGKPARRETNTMPQWAGSCWYYLRYLDPKNEKAPVDPKLEKYWMPVDLYVGGTEHAVLHLLYARFWHKVLFDAGIVSTKEPFQKLFNQGMILAWSFQDESGRYYHPHDVEERDGKPVVKATGTPLKTQVEKMSKSRLNVVSPDEIIAEFGADAMRLYEMFMGPLEIVKPWQTRDIEGVSRFLQRVWRLVHDEDDGQNPQLADVPPSPELKKVTHRAIAGVTEDLGAMRFNTAISKMMVLVNELTSANPKPKWCVEQLVLLLAPFAPHAAEELWRRLGHAGSLAYEAWPAYDAAELVDATVTLPVSINGKLKEKLEVPRGADQASIEKMVLANERIQRSLGGKPVRKVIYVEGRMVNLVV
jgi:leucyl-tRNA synthetase